MAPGQHLSIHTLPSGYEQVRLRSGGKSMVYAVHRLVAICFIGPRPEGCGVNHKNGIKTDNRLDNLEYLTVAENTQHAIRTGLRPSKRFGALPFKSG